MKTPTCKHCGKEGHYQTFCPYKKRSPISKSQSSSENRKSLKKAVINPVREKYKPTGELALFLKIYADRKGLCDITGEAIPFDVGSFAHILGKGAYPSLRLDESNIIMIKKEIHDLYDNHGKEKLLAKYPTAILIYDKKEQLKHKYYNQENIIERRSS